MLGVRVGASDSGRSHGGVEDRCTTGRGYIDKWNLRMRSATRNPDFEPFRGPVCHRLPSGPDTAPAHHESGLDDVTPPRNRLVPASLAVFVLYGRAEFRIVARSASEG